MRFYLDECLSDTIAATARDHFGLDVVSAHALGMDHAPDEEQLAFAARLHRCLVTRNGSDFIRLTRRFMAESLPHAGVIAVSASFTGREFMQIARGLAEIHARYPEDVYPYLVVYLPNAAGA
jgi:predicted nuclease of predicted toxin-antitoxin system